MNYPSNTQASHFADIQGFKLSVVMKMTPINDIVMKSELKMYKLYRKPIKRLIGPFIA